MSQPPLYGGTYERRDRFRPSSCNCQASARPLVFRSSVLRGQARGVMATLLNLDIKRCRFLFDLVNEAGGLVVLVFAWYQTLRGRRRLFVLNVDLLLFFYRKIFYHLGRVNRLLLLFAYFHAIFPRPRTVSRLPSSECIFPVGISDRRGGFALITGRNKGNCSTGDGLPLHGHCAGHLIGLRSPGRAAC